MDKVCELVGRLAKAPQVYVYKRDSQTGPMEILGQYGFPFASLGQEWHIKSIDSASSLALAFKDVRTEAALENHPLLTGVPRARTLVVLRVPQDNPATNVVMTIVNPNELTFTDPGRIPALVLLAQVVGASLSSQYTGAFAGAPSLTADAGRFEEEASGSAKPERAADQSAAAFLLRTLPVRHRLLHRNGVSYTSVRTWRSALKPFQIDALRSLKEQADTDSFARVVGKEVADAIISQLGKGLIAQVVPIPGGSSARSDAFSVRVANRVAEVLGCKVVEALALQVPRGSSHPRKSAKITSIEVTMPLEGATLVVDDVISSGKHVELAIKALRDKGILAFAIGWIAA